MLVDGVSYGTLGVHDWASRLPITFSVIGLCYSPLHLAFGFRKVAWRYAGLSIAMCIGFEASTEESATALQQIRERVLQVGENHWAGQVEIQELAVTICGVR